MRAGSRIKYGEKVIRIPKLSTHLAEFLGAINGDGHLGQSYALCIVSHKVLDKPYLQAKIAPSFRSLFALEPSEIVQRNCMKIIVNSKQLFFFLHTYYGVPMGKKTHKLKIPPPVLENKPLQLAYLRGLFDTDGTFYGRRDNEPVVGYTSLSPNYLASIKKLLQENGFHFGMSGKDLYLYRKNEIARFFTSIKPANQKHLIKYRLYKKEGIILKTNELLKLMLRR